MRWCVLGPLEGPGSPTPCGCSGVSLNHSLFPSHALPSVLFLETLLVSSSDPPLTCFAASSASFSKPGQRGNSMPAAFLALRVSPSCLCFTALVFSLNGPRHTPGFAHAPQSVASCWLSSAALCLPNLVQRTSSQQLRKHRSPHSQQPEKGFYYKPGIVVCAFIETQAFLSLSLFSLRVLPFRTQEAERGKKRAKLRPAFRHRSEEPGTKCPRKRVQNNKTWG